MTDYTFPPVAAARPRILSTLGSPFAVPTAGDSWLRNSNSIAATMRTVVPTVVVTPATAPLRNVQRGDHGAAKQAAPPRGVPR